MELKVYFSDFFEVDKNIIDEYGAFNISLINDLPLFIDPFLLFNSDKKEYQELHKNMLEYLRFLRNYSSSNTVSQGIIDAWYIFPEVKQNWLGFSKTGNRGNGLGSKFAKTLNKNLKTIFSDFGSEKITNESHLEKLSLLDKSVGKDHISDFTTNLIHNFLLEYTSNFSEKYIDEKYLAKFNVPRAYFNYSTKSWVTKEFLLPKFENDYVLLTPKNILTKDDIWINSSDMIDKFHYLPTTIENESLREQINMYFKAMLPENPKKKQVDEAVINTIIKFPTLLDYYLKYKEEHKNEATEVSKLNVKETEEYFIKNIESLVGVLSQTEFYNKKTDSFTETKKRIEFLKEVIEKNDGYRFFYDTDGVPISREQDIQLLFKLTWFASKYDVNREVNNGRGPVDYKISNGALDMTLVEFKLAKNTKLKQNLQNQVEIYKEANKTDKAFKVIIYFTMKEFEQVKKILKELDLEKDETIYLIDAIKDNKISASNVK